MVNGDAGLYQVRARWYDPQTGRFVSEAPIGLAGGMNVYAYAANRPVNFTDPSGAMPPRTVCARPDRRKRRAALQQHCFRTWRRWHLSLEPDGLRALLEREFAVNALEGLRNTDFCQRVRSMWANAPTHPALGGSVMYLYTGPALLRRSGASRSYTRPFTACRSRELASPTTTPITRPLRSADRSTEVRRTA